MADSYTVIKICIPILGNYLKVTLVDFMVYFVRGASFLGIQQQ